MSDTARENGYKDLETIYPTVSYRVFRDANENNPIAVQYWFFYYYNDWSIFDHQGDWETFTVFLDEYAKPVEVIFSTHYEANRFSWEFVKIAYDSHPKVHVANGGHGSYRASGTTEYYHEDTGAWLTDNHQGEKEVLNPQDYFLLSLIDKEALSDSWIRFEERWGKEDTSPKGSRLRTDAPDNDDWERAKHKPFNENCTPRYATNIYGYNIDNDESSGPWFWASGYGLDDPWESINECKISKYKYSLTSIFHLLLLKSPPSATTIK